MSVDPIVFADGLFAKSADDWRVHIVQAGPRNAVVFYVGSYPYNADGTPLWQNARSIVSVWDETLPGARQISELQKRIAHSTTPAILEPDFSRRHA